MANLLNAGCGTWYADGWINTDVWEDENTKPDLVVKSGEPYPFPDNHFDAIFLGHVLEHIDWDDVPVFLMDMKRIVKPEAPILVVGPDVIKTIKLWAEGKEPWHMVLSTMEHADINYQPNREAEWWDGAAHKWNCHEERLKALFHALDFSWEDIYHEIPNDPSQKSWYDPATNITWPVVGKHHWQCAFRIYA